MFRSRAADTKLLWAASAMNSRYTSMSIESTHRLPRVDSVYAECEK